MRGGDFIHGKTSEIILEGWIMNPNYCEILRFHDLGDMLLKINRILTYLEIRGEVCGAAGISFPAGLRFWKECSVLLSASGAVYTA